VKEFRTLMVGILAIGLAGSAAGCGLDVTTICKAAGGAYAGGACIRWSPSQQAAQEACETSGGVYQGGLDTCEFGMGGP
jgi:hypothetical protein